MAIASQILKQKKTAKADTSTSQGLYQLAVQSGLQRDADRILASQQGEDIKKIFSGGFISDIFDSLNALQYGVVGVLKGKSFLEGVQTRQSFSDKDALGDMGLPGTIAGIALDIAVDPLTYIAPATVLKKVPGLAKLGTAVKSMVFGKKVQKAVDVGGDITKGARSFETIEGGTKAGKWLADKFVWMFGKDKVYKEAYQRSVKNIAVGTQNVADMAKGIANLTPEVTKKLLKKDSAGRLARVGLKELQKILTPEEFAKVAPAWQKIDDLGKQAVDLGLLSKGKFEENFGEYIKNAYTEYETAKKGIFSYGKIGVKGIKTRQDAWKIIYQPKDFQKSIIKEFTNQIERDAFAREIAQKGGKILQRIKPLTAKQLKDLGQIDNPAYLLFKSTFDLTKDIENAKLLGTTAKAFGTDVAQEGFKQLPKTAKYGLAGGKYVPENIAKDIMEIIEPSKEMAGKALMANFKFAKVILNPATHARNIVSNQVLNWWKLGMNPLDPRTLKVQGEAIGEIAKKGGKWMDEAKTAGYGLDTFASQELRTLLDSPEALGIGKKIGNTFEKAKTKLGNIYQEEENFAKLSAFIFQRKKGLGIEDAWKAAESATFNYAQVTPFIRKLRTSLFGFPFITFTTKATPLAVETALKAPGRISVFGKIKGAIEEQSDLQETARERAAEPGYIKDGFYIKLPIKDKQGRSAYFDLTYIIPFGDLVSGNFFDRQVDRESGTRESLPSALMSKSPFFQFIKEIGKNQDFYGDKIWQDSDSTDKQLGDLMRHLSKTYLPPLVADQIPGGYNAKGERRTKGLKGALTASSENEQRNLMQEMLRNVGAKIQPIDVDIQETYSEWNKQKALETLLREKGVGAEFSKFFVPKSNQ